MPIVEGVGHVEVFESGEGSCIKTPHISTMRYSVINVGDFF